MLIRIIVFLLLNFGALAIGGIFTGKGVPSDWYAQLDKAPWTPPSWMFGVAWSTIMVCFTVYMSYLWPNIENKKWIILLFTVQWILNVAWNPVFFSFHETAIALFIIVALTLLVGYLFFNYLSILKTMSFFILPYLIWLVIATSLNAYITLQN